ncbi:reverse transcriptase domain-containing protein [Roseateles sp. P5_E4]
MQQKWIHKYQLKPGKWVFHPSDEARIVGMKIKLAVRKCWTPPGYYYHLRQGGHVAALKAHLNSTAFLHLDIRDFFSRVNRSRITRCLKSRVGYSVAREYANDSTVRHPTQANRYMLPYGFIQSPLLASLALFDSALGKRLDQLSKIGGVVVSVYVDDIVVSCSDEAVLLSYLQELAALAVKSAFDLNDEKQEGPAPLITAFNVEVWHQGMQIRQQRMLELKNAFDIATGPPSKAGIKSYVTSINDAQAGVLV